MGTHMDSSRDGCIPSSSVRRGILARLFVRFELARIPSLGWWPERLSLIQLRGPRFGGQGIAGLLVR